MIHRFYQFTHCKKMVGFPLRGSRERALGWEKGRNHWSPLDRQSAGSRSTPEANHGVLDHHEEQDLVEVVPCLVSQEHRKIGRSAKMDRMG